MTLTPPHTRTAAGSASTHRHEAVTVCILAHGHPGYYQCAAVAAQSVLRHTDFNVFLTHGGGTMPVTEHSRLTLAKIFDGETTGHRSARFLAKFHALESCLARRDSEWIVMMDADAVFVRQCYVQDLRSAVGKHGMAMVEQTGITGSTMNRAAFLEHYTRHTLTWFDAPHASPSLAEFRYFNSGVVIMRRSTCREFLDWARQEQGKRPAHHRVGEHMIGDQDYYQFWAHHQRPGNCAELPWEWNHCEHWDSGFPHPDARIVHFSNFCLGPESTTPDRMRRAAGITTDTRPPPASSEMTSRKP